MESRPASKRDMYTDGYKKNLRTTQQENKRPRRGGTAISLHPRPLSHPSPPIPLLPLLPGYIYPEPPYPTNYPHPSLPPARGYSPSGIPSSSSISRRQLSASTSAYLTLSCAQSWLHRDTWYCDAWKYRSSSRTHSFTKTERLCWRTMLSLSCCSVSTVLGRRRCGGWDGGMRMDDGWRDRGFVGSDIKRKG